MKYSCVLAATRSQVHVTCDIKVEFDAKYVLHVLTLQEVSCRSLERVS